MAGTSGPNPSIPTDHCPVWCDVEERWGEHGFDEFAWQDQDPTAVGPSEGRPAAPPPGAISRLHASQLTTTGEGATVQLVQYEVRMPEGTFVTDAKIKLEASAELTTAQARRIADALLRGADLLDSTS